MASDDASRPAPRVCLVIPCFDEAERIDRPELSALLARPELDLVLVDDGSTDETPRILADVCARSGGRAELLSMGANRGKAEAVRTGLLRAIDGGAGIVGFADADMATPAAEILHLLDELNACSAKVVMGSRVKLLGTQIERNPWRHYVGRVFATVASVGLGLAVYDTQCGAKFFRSNAQLRAALARPFRSRWVFDVELIDRLLAGSPSLPPYGEEDFVEIPLRRWRDVRGSKLSLPSAARAIVHLLIVTSPFRRRAREAIRRRLGRFGREAALDAARAHRGEPADRPGEGSVRR